MIPLISYNRACITSMIPTKYWNISNVACWFIKWKQSIISTWAIHTTKSNRRTSSWLYPHRNTFSISKRGKIYSCTYITTTPIKNSEFSKQSICRTYALSSTVSCISMNIKTFCYCWCCSIWVCGYCIEYIGLCCI